MVLPAWIGPAISIGGMLLGGRQSSNSAREAQQAANEAAERQLAYDTEGWELTKEKILADRAFAQEQILLQASNERELADYKDAVNLERYNYDLMIRDREQASLDTQYDKSDLIYNSQINLNTISAEAATNDELRKFEEIEAEAAFDKQEAQLEQLMLEGKMRARGVTGKSVEKGVQATLADYGRQIAMIDASIESGGLNTRAVIEEISRDRTSADLAAYAQKMLDPGMLPDPIAPLPTPVAERMMPRALGEYDFGPRPVLGAFASPAAAANQAWGTAITSIAGTVGTQLSNWALKD